MTESSEDLMDRAIKMERERMRRLIRDGWREEEPHTSESSEDLVKRAIEIERERLRLLVRDGERIKQENAENPLRRQPYSIPDERK